MGGLVLNLQALIQSLMNQHYQSVFLGLMFMTKYMRSKWNKAYMMTIMKVVAILHFGHFYTQCLIEHSLIDLHGNHLSL